MNWAILGPLLTFAGLFIGAFLTQNRETKKMRKDRLTEAYTKLLNVSSDSASPRSQQIMVKQIGGAALSEEEVAWSEAQHQRWVNAHSNVLIYGSKRVIEALSIFYDSSVSAPREQQARAYTALIEAMRADSDAESYAQFSAHVDNILVTGPERRRAMMQQAAAAAAAGRGFATFQPS